MLEVLEEALVQAVGRQVVFDVRLQPGAVRGDAVGGVEAQAAEGMSEDLGAFLR